MTRISALPDDTAPTSTDSIPMLDVETMTTKRTTIARLEPMSNPYKFSAYRNAAANTGNNAFAKITFDTELFDSNSNFDTSNGRYTVAVTGYYYVTAAAHTGVSTVNPVISIFKNGSEFIRGNKINTTLGSGAGLQVSDLVYLAAGDYIEIYINTNPAVAMEVGTGPNHPRFSAFLVSRT